MTFIVQTVLLVLMSVGDDADELLAEFAAEFRVDMSDFDFTEYFPEEASSDMHYYLTTTARSKYQNPVANAIRFLEGKIWRLFAKKEDFKTLTISDLINAVNKGKR